MRIKSGDMISREFPICIYLICDNAKRMSRDFQEPESGENQVITKIYQIEKHFRQLISQF